MSRIEGPTRGTALSTAASKPSVVVIFSKDRPLQLDATLRSLELNCSDLEVAEIHVLYTTSEPRFAAGYRVLARDHSHVAVHREVDFKRDLIGLVDGSDLVLFIVDDTLFVGELSINVAIGALERDPTCLGVSYRLGRNTTYCYTLDTPQGLPAFEVLGSGLLAFAWTEADHDFGYPLELSSSLYRSSDMLPLLAGLDYENPNTLETVLSQRASSFRDSRPRLACYQQSVALSVPANLVQTAWGNRNDGRPHLSAEALDGRYAEGYRLDVEHYQGFVPNACHQELEFLFRKDPAIPTVSVVTRCYNQAQYLPEAVRSVAAQTFADWEMVIVDDGSPDDTTEVAGRLADELGGRIRLVRQANAGLSGAMNAGVAAARGRYILPLDADDMIEPTMLEKTVAMLERDESIAIAYTDLQQFGQGSDLIQARDFDPARLPEANHLSYCSLYRREIWDAVGGYNPNMTWGYEDWDFWVGAAELGYVARRIAEPLFLYRIRSNSMFATTRQHDAELRHRMRLNHPLTYRMSRRVTRWVVDLALRVRRRLRRAARTSTGSIR